jgi:SAM-dependent methyltransferase
MEVLDEASGNGNFAVLAARVGASVPATDLTPRMIELGRERSMKEGLPIEWLEADAQKLPFPDGSFDAVASVVGAMFAPDPDHTAAELFRVARPGGWWPWRTTEPRVSCEPLRICWGRSPPRDGRTPRRPFVGIPRHGVGALRSVGIVDRVRGANGALRVPDARCRVRVL